MVEIGFKDIRIPEPCHEDWNKMTPEEKGRFCASCQKVVYDFTRATEEEFNELVAEKGKVCGHFREGQVASNDPVEKSFWTGFRKFLALAGVVILFNMLTIQLSFAQTINTGGKGVEVQMPDLREKQVMKENMRIMGLVEERLKRDKQTKKSKDGISIRGVRVTLQDMEGNVLAVDTTDSNGYFELVVPDSVNWNQNVIVKAERNKGLWRYGATASFKTTSVTLIDPSFVLDTFFIVVKMKVNVKEKKRWLRRGGHRTMQTFI